MCAALLVYGCGRRKRPDAITPPSATLVSVAVRWRNSVVAGSTIPLAGHRHHSDGSTQTVTATSSWNSSTAAATVATGVVTGVGRRDEHHSDLQNVTSAPFAVQVTARHPPQRR